jgi:hypothetical protein
MKQNHLLILIITVYIKLERNGAAISRGRLS